MGIIFKVVTSCLFELDGARAAPSAAVAHEAARLIVPFAMHIVGRTNEGRGRAVQVEQAEVGEVGRRGDAKPLGADEGAARAGYELGGA